MGIVHDHSITLNVKGRQGGMVVRQTMGMELKHGQGRKCRRKVGYICDENAKVNV